MRSIHPQNFITIASIVWRYAPDKIQVWIKTRGPRWPWIAHLIFWDCSCQFFFFFYRFQRRIYKNFFMSVQCKKPPYHVYWQIKISRTILKRVTQGKFLWDYFEIWPIVSEDFLWFCLCSYSQVAPIHQSLVHGQIKLSLTFLREVTLETFLWIWN